MNKKIFFVAVLLAVLLIPYVSSAQSAGISVIIGKIQFLLGTVGYAFVFIAWLIAGILYLTSMGSPEKMGTAKKAMIAAIIGTILVIFGRAAADIYQMIQNALLQGT